MKQYLSKHMKSEDVRLGKHLNEELKKINQVLQDENVPKFKIELNKFEL